MSAILLAEDSQTHAALMRSILRSDGHEVQWVPDGRKAIESLDRGLPELVVSDLRMPEINGMELVQAIASRFPQLPSVVVTARGSESLAVDALALGAANFVPKNSLDKLLSRVVYQTIQLAQINAVYEDIADTWERPEFSLTLPSEICAIGPAVRFLVQSMATSGDLNATERVRVGTAVASSLLNAVCFGSLEIHDDEDLLSRLLSGDVAATQEMRQRAASEPYRDHTVCLKVSIDRVDTRVSVTHTGRGQMARLSPPPGTPESFELEQCRGMMLMTSFMDDVIFRSGSSEVVMVKRHQR